LLQFFQWRAGIKAAMPLPLAVQFRMKKGQATEWDKCFVCPSVLQSLMAGWRERYLAHKNPTPLIPRCSLSEQVEEDMRGTK